MAGCATAVHSPPARRCRLLDEPRDAAAALLPRAQGALAPRLAAAHARAAPAAGPLPSRVRRLAQVQAARPLHGAAAAGRAGGAARQADRPGGRATRGRVDEPQWDCQPARAHILCPRHTRLQRTTPLALRAVVLLRRW
eukprot:2127962-Prymnesium_polylepis.1